MPTVFGYIDPGSGSLVIQALIAALVGMPFFFRRQIGRLVSAVRGRDEPTDSSDDAGNHHDGEADHAARG